MSTKPPQIDAGGGSQPHREYLHATPELRQHIEQDPPKVVHHYTSQLGLLGIITTGEIWATSVNNLNDSREFEHAKSVAIKLIDGQLMLKTDETAKRHLGYLRYAAETAGINICVSSWSTKADDLSQWRAYSGRSGTGYSIDMSGAALRRFAAAQEFIFAPCVYDVQEQERLLSGLIDADLVRNIQEEKKIADIPDRELAEFQQRLIEDNGGDFGYT
jgi:hypothetical protein